MPPLCWRVHCPGCCLQPKPAILPRLAAIARNPLHFQPIPGDVQELSYKKNLESDNWTREELKASVEAYLDMKYRMQSGDEVNKKQCYRDLSKKFGRSEKAYEYRMQNISYVLSLAGREWVAGLLPASNVGVNVAAQIEDILAEIEKRFPFIRLSFYQKIKSKHSLTSLYLCSATTLQNLGTNNPRHRTATALTHYRSMRVEVREWTRADGAQAQIIGSSLTLRHRNFNAPWMPLISKGLRTLRKTCPTCNLLRA